MGEPGSREAGKPEGEGWVSEAGSRGFTAERQETRTRLRPESEGEWIRRFWLVVWVRG
jgi:hypothetical protein